MAGYPVGIAGLPVLNLVALNLAATIAVGPLPLNVHCRRALGLSLWLGWRIWHSEGELGCDWLIKFHSIRNAILILSTDSEVVLLVWLQSDDLIMKTSDKAASLAPVVGSTVKLLHDVIGDVSSAVVRWRPPGQCACFGSDVVGINWLLGWRWSVHHKHLAGGLVTSF